MRLGWLVGNYVDPGFGLSRARRRTIGRLAHERYMPPAVLTRFTFLVVLPPVLLGIAALTAVLQWLGYGGRNGPFMLGLVALVLLFWLWSAWAYARIYAGPFRRAMRHIGHDVCVACGYRLEGLPRERVVCPECGAARVADKEEAAGGPGAGRES